MLNKIKKILTSDIFQWILVILAAAIFAFLILQPDPEINFENFDKGIKSRPHNALEEKEK